MTKCVTRYLGETSFVSTKRFHIGNVFGKIFHLVESGPKDHDRRDRRFVLIVIRTHHCRIRIAIRTCSTTKTPPMPKIAPMSLYVMAYIMACVCLCEPVFHTIYRGASHLWDPPNVAFEPTNKRRLFWMHSNPQSRRPMPRFPLPFLFSLYIVAGCVVICPSCWPRLGPKFNMADHVPNNFWKFKPVRHPFVALRHHVWLD